MFGLDAKKSKDSAEKDSHAKGEFDLKNLKRVDLLELLYEQASENEKNAASVAELTELTERLKQRLNDKDAQIEHLKQRLDAKDAEIAELMESNSLYASAADMIDVDDLVKFQEMALREYLSYTISKK